MLSFILSFIATKKGAAVKQATGNDTANSEKYQELEKTRSRHWDSRLIESAGHRTIIFKNQQNALCGAYSAPHPLSGVDGLAASTLKTLRSQPFGFQTTALQASRLRVPNILLIQGAFTQNVLWIILSNSKQTWTNAQSVQRRKLCKGS